MLEFCRDDADINTSAAPSRHSEGDVVTDTLNDPTESLPVNITNGALETVRGLASLTGKRPEIVISDALALEKFVLEAQEGGGRLYIRKPDGSLHEVTIK